MRRALYNLDAELKLCFKDSVPVIEVELEKRLLAGQKEEGVAMEDSGYSVAVEKQSMWQAFKSLVRDRPWR